MVITGVCGLRVEGLIALELQPLRSKFKQKQHMVVHGGWRRSHGARLFVRAVLTEAPPRRVEGEESTSKREMGLTDTRLDSTVEHKAWVGFGTSATLGIIAKGMVAASSSADVAGVCLGAIGAYVLADLGTGIYHWGIDNYGDADTPVFGPQIDAFQGHHQRPWTITKREFSNNVHAIARPVGFALLPFLLLPSNPAADVFLGVFLGLVVLSQQIHAWAHSKKSQLPPLVNYLQEKGVLVTRKMHGAHHKPPYDINYCIVSGAWNPLLNQTNFFQKLESAIFSTWRVAPRCWTETAPEWIQDGSYFEDGSDVKVNEE